MSGRDLKKFVLDHRANSTDKLVNRFLTRQTSSAGTYRHVDYELLQAEAQHMRSKAASTLGRVKRLARVSKQGREEQIVKRHRMVWERENQRLNEAIRSVERQMETLMQTHTELKEFMKESMCLCRQLDSERCGFQQNTVQPIFDLKLDLQTWIKEMRKSRLGDVRRKQQQIREVLDSVKEQQESVLSLLSAEQVMLETEIHDMMSSYVNEDMEEKCWDIEDGDDDDDDLFGVPGEVLEWACPDESLRCDIIREFHQLDGKYLAHLEQLREKYKQCLSSVYGGWSGEDHLHFCHIVEQYPADIPQRRSLWMDRLRREMPQLSRQQLVEHEDWYLSRQYYSHRRRACRNAWSRDRRDLLEKVRHVFEEACWRREAAAEVAKARDQQQEICRDLSEKVSQFRRQKLEAMEIEAAIEARTREAELEKQQIEGERRSQKRQAQRQRLDEYYSERQRLRAEAETRDKERLAQLHADMAKQAVRDKERVEYRQEEYVKKVQAKEEAEREEQRQAEVKQEELERLREKVRVTVDSDPVRMMQSTEASTAKFSRSVKEELDLQQPLFPLHSYTDQQVTSDMRFRVTAALRDANMLQTDYARSILARIKPSHPPRKDQESSLFK